MQTRPQNPFRESLSSFQTVDVQPTQNMPSPLDSQPLSLRNPRRCELPVQAPIAVHSNYDFGLQDGLGWSPKVLPDSQGTYAVCVLVTEGANRRSGLLTGPLIPSLQVSRSTAPEAVNE